MDTPVIRADGGSQGTARSCARQWLQAVVPVVTADENGQALYCAGTLLEASGHDFILTSSKIGLDADLKATVNIPNGPQSWQALVVEERVQREHIHTRRVKNQHILGPDLCLYEFLGGLPERIATEFVPLPMQRLVFRAWEKLDGVLLTRGCDWVANDAKGMTAWMPYGAARVTLPTIDPSVYEWADPRFRLPVQGEWGSAATAPVGGVAVLTAETQRQSDVLLDAKAEVVGFFGGTLENQDHEAEIQIVPWWLVAWVMWSNSRTVGFNLDHIHFMPYAARTTLIDLATQADLEARRTTDQAERATPKRRRHKQ